MELHVYPEVAQLSTAVAEWMTTYIADTLARKDRFTIALSGGSTPEMLHRTLAAEPYRSRIDWSKLHVFWGDERAVPFTDDRNNAKMAYDTLLNQVAVPPYHIHVMRTDISPEASAAAYEKILHEYFEVTGPTFDLVLLGMGDDGHTLSLFPGTEVVRERKAWVKAYYLTAQEMYRITLTAPIANRAGAVLFLVAGEKKATALKAVLEGDMKTDVYPSQLIQPEQGQLLWFVDEAAAANLAGF